MNKPRIVTLFSGGGGSDIGAMAAGCEIVHAVEYDAKIADVYRKNIGDHVEVCKVEDADPTPWIGKVDGLLASPVCKSFSVAKTGGKELQGDIDSANAVARWIVALEPKFVVIENVAGYLKSQSFKIIDETLNRLGYKTDCSILNSADFGVPQTRKRMILRAKRSRMHTLFPTHAKTPGHDNLFGETLKHWVGWYEAIEDLLPGLPDSQFAPWQLKRIDASLLKSMGIEAPFVCSGGNKSESFLQFAVENRPTIPGIRNKDQLFMTVVADNATNSSARALLVESKFPGRNGQDGLIKGMDVLASTVTSIDTNSGATAMLMGVQGENGELARDVDAPAPTITSAHSAEKYRAMLIQGDCQGDRDITVLTEDEPCFSLTTSGGGRVHKAVLVSRNQSGSIGNVCNVKSDKEPAFAVSTSSSSGCKALLVHGQDMRTMPVIMKDDPAFTIVGGTNMPRAFLTDGHTGNGGSVIPMIDAAEPSPTVTAGAASHGSRAFLCDGQANNHGEAMTVRDNEEPSMTISASCEKRPVRAFVDYRIVKLSPRCLARFQSVPDWYVLPEKSSLAGTVIGNMVPPLLMQRVIESILK